MEIAVSTQEWIDSHMPQIEAYAALNDEVLNQNALAEKLQAEVTTTTVLEAGLSHTAAAQTTSFEALVAAQRALPLEELLSRQDKTLVWLAGLAIRNEQLNAGEPMGADRIRRDAAIVASYIPDLAEKLREIQIAEIESLKERERQSLDGERLAAERVARKVETLLQTVGIMPIPELLTPAQRMEIAMGTPDGPDLGLETVEEDEFPDEREAHARQERIAERVRGGHIDRTSGASEILGLILAEDPTVTWTIPELAEFIYGKAASENPRTYLIRVSTLISHLENGTTSIISDVLGQKGLAFQRGVRTRKDPQTGKKRGHSIAVFRAAPATDVIESELIAPADSDAEYTETRWLPTHLRAEGSD